MRLRGAPESRGSRPNVCGIRLGRFGLSAFLIASATFILFGFAQNRTQAADASARFWLQPALPDPKPDFGLQDLDGERHEFRASAGRTVLVHFFATWCEPCREELTSLSRLMAEPRGKQLTVLAVNVAEVPARVRRFLDSAPVSFPVLLDTNRSVTKAWGVSALPTTFVLDRALAPRLFVEGDLDWTRADVVATLDQIGAESR
jgi:thiol-disulfide isomerase/thioredoxin